MTLPEVTSPPASPAPIAGERRRQHVWVVLPAFNEELSLPKLLAALDEAMFESNLAYHVVVMDDGSTDATAAIARQAALRLPLVVESHPVNLGLGMTIRDGLMKAASLAEPRDLIVTMDADNSHTPELILRMVRLAREGHDVVIASRYQPGSRVRGVPLARRALSYWGGWLFRLIFPLPGVRDYTCGYRAYKAAVLQRVIASYGESFFDQEGFQCMVDILLKLRREPDLIFGEVPLILRYDLKEGASKMRVWRTIKNTLGLMAKRRLGSP
jgi:dolichol-phosphate mannosyltransferase